MRIAVGGFQHETNTFAPTKADYAAFVMPGAWPGLTRGEELFDAVAGINLPVAGFIAEALARGHALVPLLWCQASPSAQVTDDAFERVAAMLIADLAAQGPLDAVYLDLHGAMVVESFEDGEGELLRRVRAIVGPSAKVVASLDLHANVTPEMVAHADALVAYRTYPHIDMDVTGRRAARLLDRLLREKTPAHKSLRQMQFLIPLPWQCTTIEPGQSVYEALAAMEERDPELLGISFTPGFPPADIRHCGPAVFAYAVNQAAADRAVAALAGIIDQRKGDFAGKLWSAAEAVHHAIEASRTARRPIVLADTQDNPGGGANADGTALLADLVRQGASGAVVANLFDPAAAAAAHRAGEGATIEIALGAHSGVPGNEPLRGKFRVVRLGDGNFTATGPFYLGSRMKLGPMALLEIDGVRIVVASRKQQAADQAMLRHLGVEPAEQKILALKSSVHFRADFAPVAEEILVVAAPGPNVADPAELAYRRLRPGVRLGPLGAVFRGA